MPGFGTIPFGTGPFGVGLIGPALTTVLYSAGREGFLDGTIAWVVPSIKASLLRGYTFSDSHRFVSDISGTVVATATLVDRTATNGRADAGDTTFASVAVGAAISSAVLFQSSAVTGGADIATSAQRLIGFLDLSLVSVVPNGGDLTLAWSNDLGRIFAL